MSLELQLKSLTERISSEFNNKSNINHTHPVADLAATGPRDETTFLRGDGAWATPEGGGGVMAAHTSFASSAEWRIPMVMGNGTVTIPAGTLPLAPIPLPYAVSLHGLACEVKIGAEGGEVTVCIYADDEFRPGALVAATSALDASSVGVKGEALPPVILNPGLYWYGVLVTGVGVGLQRTLTKEHLTHPWAGMSAGSGTLPSIASGNNGTVCMQTGLSSPPSVSSRNPRGTLMESGPP